MQTRLLHTCWRLASEPHRSEVSRGGRVLSSIQAEGSVEAETVKVRSGRMLRELLFVTGKPVTTP